MCVCVLWRSGVGYPPNARVAILDGFRGCARVHYSGAHRICSSIPNVHPVTPIQRVLLAVTHTTCRRYLCAVGKYAEAAEVIREAAKANGKVRRVPCCRHTNVLTPLLLSQDMPPFTLKPIQGHVDASVSKLFVPALRKSTLLIWLVWFAFGAGYYGVRLPGHCVVLPWCLPVDGAVCCVAQIVLFTPELFAHEATTDQYGINYASILISSASECACCRNGSVLCPARVAHTSNVDADVGVTVAILCIDRFGRVSTQVWMYTLCGVLTPLLAVMLHIDAPVVLFVSIAVTARALVMGASSVTWVYPAEVRAWNWMAVAVVAGGGMLTAPRPCAAQFYSTAVRSTGHSAANACGRLGAFVAPFLANMDAISVWVPALAFAVLNLVAAGANVFLKVCSRRVLPFVGSMPCVRSLTRHMASVYLQETGATALPQEFPSNEQDARDTAGHQLPAGKRDQVSLLTAAASNSHAHVDDGTGTANL